MYERLKKLRKELALTQQEFADRLKISRGNIATYEVGKSVPSDSVINLICNTFNVNENWLRTGNGTMFNELSRDEEIAEFLATVQLGGNKTFKHRFVTALSRLNDDAWEILAQFCEELAKEPDEDDEGLKKE